MTDKHERSAFVVHAPIRKAELRAAVQNQCFGITSVHVTIAMSVSIISNPTA
jgi:hypothetical protein